MGAARDAIAASDWRSWPWQMQHRIRSAADLSAWIDPSDDERAAIEALATRFRFVITPYYASLMDPADPACPIRRQVVPRLAELDDPLGLADPLDEVAEDIHLLCELGVGPVVVLVMVLDDERHVVLLSVWQACLDALRGEREAQQQHEAGQGHEQHRQDQSARGSHAGFALARSVFCPRSMLWHEANTEWTFVRCQSKHLATVQPVVRALTQITPPKVKAKVLAEATLEVLVD